MYRDPFPGHLSNLINRANEVALLVDEIDAVPTQLRQLQAELASITAQINFTQQQLLDEQRSWDGERRRSLDAQRQDWLVGDQLQKDLVAQIEEAKAKAIALQNLCAAEQRRVEEIVREWRKLQRRYPDLAEEQVPEAVSEPKKGTEK